MSATIYDIAKKAGVSIATVSRVFSDGSKVSEKNRRKVLEVANEVGYHPQGFARGLAGKNNKQITAIVPILSNYFFMEVLAGIQNKVMETDYDLNIYNVTSFGSDMVDQIEHVLKKRMSGGYLLISIHMNNDQWKSLQKYNLPITLVDEYFAHFDSVSVDSTEGAYNAVTYLLGEGYRKIAFISARAESKPIRQRTKGFNQAMQEYGLSLDEDLVLRSDLDNRDGFTEKSGYESMSKLLKMDSLPDACLCASDIQALGALKAMQDAEIYLPMISFDDIEIAEYIGLSTMRQPMYDMGYKATQKLIDRIEGKTKTVSHTVFSPELILRESTNHQKFKSSHTQ